MIIFTLLFQLAYFPMVGKVRFELTYADSECLFVIFKNNCCICLKINGDLDGIRTRDLCRDRAAF